MINTFTIDQTQNPSDPNDPSSTWQSLGTFYVTGTTLQVQIAQTSGYYGVSIAVADAVRLQQIVGNAATDDNFHVMPGSPTIDAGDPASVSFNEPEPNGGRVNLGFDGNTSAAATSPQQLIQVLAPGGFGKLVDGQQVNIQWRSDGLTPSQNVLSINTGNGSAVGAFLSNSYQTSGYSYDNGSISGPIDLSGVADPAPMVVYQSYSSASYGVGNTLSYNLPVPDGTYTIRLDFADPNDSAEGQRTFDIQLQGSTVASAYDIYQAAGDLDNKATQFTYTFTVTGGQGINLNLVNDTYTPAILSGIELTRLNPEGTANPTVDLAYSTNGGMNWMPIASGVSMDSFGAGNYSWTIPTHAPTGDNYLVSVTSDQATTVGGTSAPFTVANSGNLYYVNDSSSSGDVFTTAPGNNANDGKTAATPMASLAALLAAYTMHPGDIISIDSGTYNGVRNIVLGPNDSGIAIEGAGAASTILDRGNTNNGSYVFELDGATNVTITDIGVTGGYAGLYGDANSASTGLTVTGSSFYANAFAGVDLEVSNDHAAFSGDSFYGVVSTTQMYGLYLNNVNDATITGDVAHDLSNTGFWVYGLRDLLNGNQAHDDATGMNVSDYSGALSDLSTVSNNTVRENSSYGIVISGDVIATQNTVFNNVTGTGIAVENATASDNVVYGNTTGIDTAGTSSTITGNRIYDNSSIGIHVYRNSLVDGNYVYSNDVGVQADYTDYANYSGTIEDNLIYVNTDQAILLNSAGGALIVNNTIFELVGDAIALANGSFDIRIENNILWVESGYDIDVANDSQSGLVSDYNVFYKGTDPNAHVGFFGGIEDTFAAWQAIGQDPHSVFGNPGFVDIDGADNVLGYTTQYGGYDGGEDDNFYTVLSSLPIDRGDPWYAPATDIAGNLRVDDLGTPNNGRPDYFATTLSSSDFAATGTPMGWNGYQTSWTLDLPFSFPFSDGTYTQVDVSSSGYLQFGGGANDNDFYNSDANLAQYRRIAPLWAAIRTDLSGDDIFVDTSVSGQVTIRWQASEVQDNSPVNFSVTLFSNGNIQFDYGAGNANLSPTVGLSMGVNGILRLAPYDGQASLTSVNSVEFDLKASYVDIGAYEFLGNSNDTTPATVVGTTPAQIGSDGSLAGLTGSIVVTFSKELNPIDANAPAEYELRVPALTGSLARPTMCFTR